MCIGIWSLEHPDYALILGTNRDEFLDRPTQNAHFHSFETDGDGASGRVLSGRDELAGGSWFGINRAGRVALLTNITEPLRKYNTSRGYLISSFLLSDSLHPLEDEVGKIVPENAQLAGFNLLILAPALEPPAEGDSRTSPTVRYDPLFVTNHGGGGTLTSRNLTPQERSCGGMSNGIDGAGANLWPKVKHATDDFANVLQTLNPDKETEAELTERLFDILAWQCPHPITERAQLRQTVQVLPLTFGLEGSAKTPAVYGTRTTTVVLVTRKGQVLFIERDIWKRADDGQGVVKADTASERRFQFELDIVKTSQEAPP